MRWQSCESLIMFSFFQQEYTETENHHCFRFGFLHFNLSYFPLVGSLVLPSFWDVPEAFEWIDQHGCCISATTQEIQPRAMVPASCIAQYVFTLLAVIRSDSHSLQFSTSPQSVSVLQSVLLPPFLLLMNLSASFSLLPLISLRLTETSPHTRKHLWDSLLKRRFVPIKNVF